MPTHQEPLRHTLLDAHDAYGRRPRASTWHPILAAHEYSPGEWIMVDPSAKPYAVIRALELGGERGYRAVTWAERSEERQLIGYWQTLRAACVGAHRAHLATHGPELDPTTIYPNLRTPQPL